MTDKEVHGKIKEVSKISNTGKREGKKGTVPPVLRT
jgi:hypothetical protein